MKRLSIIAVLITCFISALLLILDSQTEHGILNSLKMEKEENSDAIEKNEQQEVPLKHAQTEAASDERKEEPEIAAVPAPEPFIIVIDPGHQAKANLEQEPIGPNATQTKYKVTGGTTGVVTGTPEYVLTLEASNILKSHLENRGFQVILTRASHDVNISNQERAEVANQHEADLFVRIHADGSENPETSGFSVLVPAKENSYTTPIYEDSYKAAQMAISHVSKEIPLNQNGIFFRNDMSGFNWSQVPVILPEIGFMTNPEEDQKLADDAYLTHLMELLANGIEEYARTK